jgi:tetratricopeptide (TPR) repeat protein
MKNLISIILFLITFNGVAQHFADKEYYLIDSLVLEELGEGDRTLMDSCLKVYHKAEHDTDKINALNGICENMMDDSWGKYQHIQLGIIQKAIASHLPALILRSLNISLAGALNNIGYIYGEQGDISKQTEYYHKSLKIYEEIGDKEGIATSLNNIGFIYNNQGDIPNALTYYHKSLTIEEELGNKKGIASSLNNIGMIYKQQGDIPNALTYLHKALKIQEEIGDKKGIAGSLNNIGMIYKHQGDIPNALTYYHKSLTIQEEIGDKKGIATSLNNIGAIYDHQGDIPNALTYYHKALTIREEIGDKKGIAISLNNIGGIYSSQGDIPNALKYYHKSLKIYQELGYKNGIAYSLNNIGTIQLEQGELTQAKSHAIRSMELAKELGFPEAIKSSARLLSDVTRKEGNFREALEMYELHILMRDSINNEATQKATIKQQSKYEYEKAKAVSDKEHEKQMALQEKEKEKQQIFTYAASGGLALVLAFLFFVANRLKVTRKQKEAIDEQKQVIEKTHDELAEHHKEITDSINYAERIQRSFLATKELLDQNLGEHFVFFKPKDVVSGDFYWAGKLNNGNFAVVNADSTGHGVPGAIMSILNISSIEKAIDQGLTEPAAIFNATRSTIIERLKKDGSEHGGKDGMDASIVLFNADKTKMTYTAAQNPIWVIREKSKVQSGKVFADRIKTFEPETLNLILFEIKAEKMPIGKHDNDHVPFEGGAFDLLKGDIVYTLTDGFQDQFGGPKGKKFMIKKMREYLLSISHLPMQEQYQKIDTVFTDWKGDLEQIDDVCIIGVRI